MAENSWQRDELGKVGEALASCLERAYPLELLWVFMTLYLLGLLMGTWRLYSLKSTPAEIFWWDR